MAKRTTTHDQAGGDHHGRPRGFRHREQFAGHKSMTRQSESADTDVNLIVARHRKTGVVTHLNHRIPQYGDYSQVGTLHDAFAQVEAAEEAFMDLPAAVRQVAENDPVKLLELLATPDGEAALMEAGLDEPERYPDELGPDELGTPPLPLTRQKPKEEAEADDQAEAPAEAD